MGSGWDPGVLDEVRRSLASLDELDWHYRAAVTSTDREQALRSTVARLVDEGAIDLAWIAQPGTTDGLVIDATAGAHTTVLQGLSIPSGAGLTGKFYQHGVVEWVDEYFAAESITHDFDGHIAVERVHGLVAVPVTRDDRRIGVLSAGVRGERTFGDRIIEHLVAAAKGVSMAVTATERTRYAAELAVHEERRRLAVELHDTVGALLYAIGAGLHGLRDPVAAPAGVAERVRALEEQTAQASRLLREALRALHASPSQVALGTAVQAECRRLEERAGLRTHLLTLGELHVLDGEALGVLTRAVREALHNVEKHARAESVSVAISVDEGELTVAVIDDGVGFNPDPASSGTGLASTAESLARLGGMLDVEANPDGGTRWRARVPLP